MKKIFWVDTPLGKMGLGEEDNYITNLWLRETQIDCRAFVTEDSPLIRKARGQLEEYFAGRRREFDLPLAPGGTDFMRAVWNALLTIPYGQTRSYKEIAECVGNVRACRAVGGANNKNPIPIFIPCHRVIGANGQLVGFGGGLDMKEGLLALEKRYSDQ